MTGPADPLSPKSPLLTMPTIFPNSFTQKHCGLEDGFRYVAMGTCAIGGIWSFVNNWMLPASMCVIAGAAITAQHIVDKNCGLRAKIINAAQRRFGQYIDALTTADATAKNLQEASKAWMTLQEQTKAELETLRQTNTDIEQGRQGIGINVEAMKAENQRLLAASHDLAKSVADKAGLIVSLQGEVKQFAEQNGKFQEELKKITGLIPEFVQKEHELELHLTTATGGLQQELDQFTIQLHQLETIGSVLQQIRTENVRLQGSIEKLQSQIEAFDAAAEELDENVEELEETQKKDEQLQKELDKIHQEFEADRLATEELQRKLSLELKRQDTSETS